MVKQTSHVHNRSHEGASHCMIHTRFIQVNLNTFKINSITAPIEELIIEQKHEKLAPEHQTVFVISALMM